MFDKTLCAQWVFYPITEGQKLIKIPRQKIFVKNNCKNVYYKNGHYLSSFSFHFTSFIWGAWTFLNFVVHRVLPLTYPYRTSKKMGLTDKHHCFTAPSRPRNVKVLAITDETIRISWWEPARANGVLQVRNMP